MLPKRVPVQRDPKEGERYAPPRVSYGRTRARKEWLYLATARLSHGTASCLSGPLEPASLVQIIKFALGSDEVSTKFVVHFDRKSCCLCGAVCEPTVAYMSKDQENQKKTVAFVKEVVEMQVSTINYQL